MQYLSTVLKERRASLGLTLKQIAEAMGVSEATVQRWESGSMNIRYDKINSLAEILHVDPSSFFGWSDGDPLPANLSSANFSSIPLLGSIACGDPILAEEHIEEYIDLPKHIHADFALVCKGDSMIGAGIHDGDVVYIRQQATVDNGQIAAVLIDNEATLKRFYLNGSTLSLVAENPSIAPLFFQGDDISNIRVIGLAIAYSHRIV